MRLTNVLHSNGEAISDREAQLMVMYDAVGEHLNEHVRTKWSNLKRGGVIGVFVMILGVAFVVGELAAVGIGVIVFGLAIIAGTYYRVGQMSPNVTIKGIEKGIWTGHVVRNQGQAMVFDATGNVQETEFQVDLLPDSNHAEKVKREIKDIDEFPVLLNDDENVEKSYLETLDDVDAAIEKAERHEIHAPVIEEDHPGFSSLAYIARRADAETIDAGGVSVPLSTAEQRVEVLSEFEDMVDEDRGESALRDVSEQSQTLADQLSGLQETAVELLNDHLNNAGDQFGLMTYHFYCPDCLSDDIETRLEQRGDEWYCETCRTTYQRGNGVPRHRIRDELVLDICDQLWVEKDDQLREIYENIEDQKTDLEEREFEQRREEIRTVDDRIKDTRERIRDLRTEARAKHDTVDRIGSLMVKYERLNSRKKQKFKQDVSNTFEQIDAETKRAIEETREVVEGRIEEAEKEARQKAELIREEERAMQREMIAYQEKMLEQQMEQAEELTRAEIEQREEHHRENMLLQTEGEISSFDTINMVRDKKGEIFGRSKHQMEG